MYNPKLTKYYKKLFRNVKAINCKLLIIPIDSKNFLSKNLSKFINFIFFLKKESRKNKVKISLEVNENYDELNYIKTRRAFVWNEFTLFPDLTEENE